MKSILRTASLARSYGFFRAEGLEQFRLERLELLFQFGVLGVELDVEGGVFLREGES
jgi:hypothetical protein